MKLNLKNKEDLSFFITVMFASLAIGFGILGIISKIFMLK